MYRFIRNILGKNKETDVLDFASEVGYSANFVKETVPISHRNFPMGAGYLVGENLKGFLARAYLLAPMELELGLFDI